MNITKLLPLLFCSMFSLSLQPTDAGSSADGSASASVFELAEGDKYPVVASGSDQQKLFVGGDFYSFNKFLPSIKDLNFVTGGGETPLMYVCRHGHLEMVKALLDKERINISCYGIFLQTALSLTAKNIDHTFYNEHKKDYVCVNGLFVSGYQKFRNRIEIINLLLARSDLKVHSDYESSERIKMLLRSIVNNKAWRLEMRLNMIGLFLSCRVFMFADLLFPHLRLKQLEIDNRLKSVLFKRQEVVAILAQEKVAEESDEVYQERINTSLKDNFLLSDEEHEVFQALRRYSFIHWRSPLRKAWICAVAVTSAALPAAGTTAGVGAGAGSSMDTDKGGK